ncbi:MAG: hypothetical protein ACRDRH_22385 [Pseudonocardia sp.]
MIGYLGTSAFVPLLVAEAGSIECRRFWNDADDVVASRLLFIEAAAALAQGARQGWLTLAAHDRAGPAANPGTVRPQLTTRATGPGAPSTLARSSSARPEQGY